MHSKGSKRERWEWVSSKTWREAQVPRESAYSNPSSFPLLLWFCFVLLFSFPPSQIRDLSLSHFPCLCCSHYESQKQWGWKRPLRSLSPTIDPSSLCPLNPCHFWLSMEKWRTSYRLKPCTKLVQSPSLKVRWKMCFSSFQWSLLFSSHMSLPSPNSSENNAKKSTHPWQRTRGNGFKLKEERFRSDIRKFFFTINGEVLEQVAQRGGGCPVSVGIQGQTGWGFERLMEL